MNNVLSAELHLGVEVEMSFLIGIDLWNETGKTKDAFVEIRQYVLALESRIESLENEIKTDTHEHVKALVNRIQTLENELKSLKK
ncbi:MAG: hypothetical protein JSV09_07045 [Thermoplasmata archaeon]|nr:MAG: hypothetical protein JSV09_07045 [Thermoplasmata archaeon]